MAIGSDPDAGHVEGGRGHRLRSGARAVVVFVITYFENPSVLVPLIAMSASGLWIP
jgi:hypothetical protein